MLWPINIETLLLKFRFLRPYQIWRNLPSYFDIRKYIIVNFKAINRMIFDGLRETELIQFFFKSSFQIKYKIKFKKSRTFFLSSKNQNWFRLWAGHQFISESGTSGNLSSHLFNISCTYLIAYLEISFIRTQRTLLGSESEWPKDQALLLTM